MTLFSFENNYSVYGSHPPYDIYPSGEVKIKENKKIVSKLKL